jgi:hypothetical protein
MPQTTTILLLLHARPAWLALSRDERADFFQNTFQPLTRKFSKSCSFRLFDSEFFHARISDFLLIETTSLDDYQDFIEMLRDTPFYAVPYFEVADIIPAKENAFLQYDEKLGIA